MEYTSTINITYDLDPINLNWSFKNKEGESVTDLLFRLNFIDYIFLFILYFCIIITVYIYFLSYYLVFHNLLAAYIIFYIFTIFYHVLRITNSM